MKILIDIGHPAHVHIFRNFAVEMSKKGHVVLFTCREKENTRALLEAYKLKYTSFGKPFRNKIGKIFGLIYFNLRILGVLLRYRPDISLGHSSMYAAQMSWLLGIPHISVEDTGNMEQIMLYRPFVKAILVPDSFHLELGKKQIRYKGNHELAYLHPDRFEPDPSVLAKLGLTIGEPYVILRFVAWGASHDSGHQGISLDNKYKVIEAFSEFAKVFISSEKQLPYDLQQYLLPTAPEEIHNVIAFSSLLFGESATMASEAAVLGVPAVYLDNTGRCYTREEEKFGLVFNYTESETDQKMAIQKGIDILKMNNRQTIWKEKQQRFLQEKIDVTAYLISFVENWQSDKPKY